MQSDFWSTADLKQRAERLKQKATEGDGSASEPLEQYPHHFTMLSFRSISGCAELHRDWADMFVIVDGQCTLVTGGVIESARAAGEGEMRGKAVVGGASQQLKAGDVVHIPAGMNHQMLMPDGASVTYFVTKVEELRQGKRI
jgi:mannose-6-phosphate isomerase-like protein (cupin superfamily)